MPEGKNKKIMKPKSPEQIKESMKNNMRNNMRIEMENNVEKKHTVEITEIKRKEAGDL